MLFDFDQEQPIYQQIAHQMTDNIFTGIFSAGQQVPSTTEISKTFNINPATVLKGMNQLVAEGLLEKKRGLGMFVTDNAKTIITQKRQANFYQDYIEKLLIEAKKLGLKNEDVIKLIEKGAVK